MELKIPKDTAALLAALENRGYSAYVVGGCVRDSLIGKTPKDWDICTSAKPEQVTELFGDGKVLPTGIKHGTVTVMCAEPCEITTFRLDGNYSDCRRPESVVFVDGVETDLARRDFTINAMAYNPREGLIDPFGGSRDLEAGIIRSVGDGERRFSEDALRILRGLRFSVSLGFDIEEKTAEAMLSKRALLKNISAERIRTELMKTLTAGAVRRQFIRFREIIAEVIPELRPCFDFEQNTVHHSYDVYEHILVAVDGYCGSDEAIKAALLLHDSAKPQKYRFYNGSAHFKGHPAASAKIAESVFARLRFDKKTAATAETLIKFHDVRFNGGMAQILKLTNLVGEENMRRLFCVMRADTLAQSDYMRAEKLSLIERGEENFRLALENDLCRGLSSLKINGADAAALGLKGREIGAALHFALNGVMNGRVENTRQNLLIYLDRFLKML